MSNFLIFTRRQDIRRISLEVEYYADVVIPTGHLKNAIAIDVDIIDGKQLGSSEKATWLGKWLRHLLWEWQIQGSFHACAMGIFPGQVIPVTKI